MEIAVVTGCWVLAYFFKMYDTVEYVLYTSSAIMNFVMQTELLLTGQGGFFIALTLKKWMGDIPTVSQPQPSPDSAVPEALVALTPSIVSIAAYHLTYSLCLSACGKGSRSDSTSSRSIGLSHSACLYSRTVWSLIHAAWLFDELRIQFVSVSGYAVSSGIVAG